MANTKIEDQIKEWKAEHGDVYELPIDDKTAYLREPNMTDYKRAFSAMQRGGDVAFGEAMLSALWLGGDDAIKNEDAYFLPARTELRDFFNYEDPITEKVSKGYQITVGDAICTVRMITRNDIKLAEKKNPSNKPFVTQEKLFELICLEKDKAFIDRQNAQVRFPLYQAIQQLQGQKTAILKKL